MDSGTIIITELDSNNPDDGKTVIYTRVSSSQNKSNLDSQVSRLEGYCLAKGYAVDNTIKEIGSGMNDQRPKLSKLLSNPSVTRIVVEHRDRLTRFGFNHISELMKCQGREVEVANKSKDETAELVDDLTSIIYSFCARMYGSRRAKRKAEEAKKVISDETDKKVCSQEK